MYDYHEKLAQFFHTFGEAKKMVLSTSANGHVTSRMISIIVMEECFYFQTDKTFRKYEQITANPNVALCIDNIQIEGACAEIGQPMDHPDFCRLYEKHFKSSFDRYTHLANETLFQITPTYIQKWIYEDSLPYVEKFLIGQEVYSKELYHTDHCTQ